MTHTKDLLAAELQRIGLTGMALKAATGFYHDFLSPLDLPTTALVNDLAAAGTPAALTLRNRVIEGEFDATQQESEEWANSSEGQETFAALVKRQ
jgi:hypothetical protein